MFSEEYMDNLQDFIDEFFPNYFIYKTAKIDGDKIALHFSTKKRILRCPHCGQETSEYATYYTRTVQDLPILDRQTYVKLRFRKMICSNKQCSMKYFNEPLDEYVSPKKRFSNRLLNLLVRIALTQPAEIGSRICKEKHIKVSGDKLLQLAKAFTPNIDKNTITQIGVDDFALKKNIGMELFSSTSKQIE